MELILKSSAILFLALCAARLLRSQSAATRHVVLTAGLVSSLTVPFMGSALPEWRIGPAAIYGRWGLTPPLEQDPVTDAAMPVTDAGQTPFSANPATPAATKTASPLRLTVARIWVGGAGLAGLILVLGAARIRWLTLRSKPIVGIKWASISVEVARRLNLRRRALLLQNDRGVLGTWGLLRPRILLPDDAETWPDERLRVVLTHELAHIKRFDWPVQILAELARAANWFNPLFWLACRWLRSESEHACDDVVLNAGFDAKDYAAHLLDLARTLNNSDRAWSPVLAMSRPPHLERRFVAMLNPSLNHRSVPRTAVFAACVVAICLTLPLAAMHASAEASQPVLAQPAVATVVVPVERPPVRVAPRVALKPVVVGKPIALSARQGLADGALSGAVFDGSGAAIPGVALTVSTLETIPLGVRETPVATSTSDETGRFEFRALPAGQYSLKTELPGFAAFRKPWIEIKPSQMTSEKVFLSVGNIVQRVEVMAAGQPRPPVPPAAPRRIRIGGNVIAANLIGQVKPVYPQSARDAGIEGIVHLQGIIGTEGTFIALRLVSSNDRDLANAALEAVKQWRYKPTLLNNEPIEVLTEIDVEFKLAQ